MAELPDDLRREQQLIAFDLARSVFPCQRHAAAFGSSRSDPMYTLSKAKEEIDLVAKHATGLAEHMLAMSGEIDARLDGFKADILSAIEAKFAELARTIHGNTMTAESSAVADLGAKVSLLTRRPAKPEAQGHQDVQPDHSSSQDNSSDYHDATDDHGSDRYHNG